MPNPHRNLSDEVRELRKMMLATSATQAGISPTEIMPKAFGVVMDIGVQGGHSATVVAFADGNASLYVTSGFGVLGGIEHENVRNAAHQFVFVAQGFYDEAAPTINYPYPGKNMVRFYLLGFEGVRVIEKAIVFLEKPDDDLFEMWIAGQTTLSALRQIAEQRR